MSEVFNSLASNIAAYLDNEGVGTYDPDGTTGNIFVESLPPKPDVAIMIESTGGARSSAKLGYDMPTIRILARGTRDPRPAKELAGKIHDALQGFAGGELVSDGIWVYMIDAVQSGGTNIGQDQNQRHRFSMNYMFDIENVTAHRE